MKNRRLDVISLGEALVDFMPDRPGQKVRAVQAWKRCLGGAPANVAVGVARLGGRSAMAGVTGDDEFGYFIADELQREGVDTTALKHTTRGKTGIGFISLTASGERSFTFYRQDAAEFLLSRALLDLPFLATAAVLHCGTNSLLTPSARAATLLAARTAKRQGQLVSCDPNLRLHIWKDPAVLKKLVRTLVPLCSVVKLSDDEIEFVTGTRDVSAALQTLRQWGATVAVVTLGPRGAVLQRGDETVAVPAPKVKVVDTTGAGDGFMAGFLYTLTRSVRSRRELDAVPMKTLREAALIGCRVGSRVVTKLGAIAGLPHSS